MPRLTSWCGKDEENAGMNESESEQSRSQENEEVGREIRRRSEHRGKFGEERKKELGVRRRPQRQGKFLSEAASSRGPAEQLLPPACMLLDIDCTETPLRDQSKHRRRSHCELGSSRGSAGQVLPPACMLLSIESPRAHTHCRLNRRGTTLRGEHGSSGRSARQACE